MLKNFARQIIALQQLFNGGHVKIDRPAHW